jgi:hypothetical protein
MANTNAPYGFRLWSLLVGGSGALPLPPVQLKFGSTIALKVGDPVKMSNGLGYMATGTNALFGICNSPVPNYGETAKEVHYPDLIPADENAVFRCQCIGTTNATLGYVKTGVKYRIGGTTSGYTGISLANTTGGVLEILGLAPGSAWGTYAEVLVMVCRGSFYGAA